MKVNSIVELNMPRIRQITRAAEKALVQTAEALHTEVVQAQVIPFDVGTLQKSTYVDTKGAGSGKASIVSSTPYARRLYFHPEYHFDKGENANARGEWYEDWLPGGKEDEFCRKTYAQLLKRMADLK